MTREKNSRVEKHDTSKDELIEELQRIIESKTEAMTSLVKNLQDNLLAETEAKEIVIERYNTLKANHDQLLIDIVVLKTEIKQKELEISNFENKLEIITTEQMKLKKNYSSTQLNLNEDVTTISDLKRDINTK